MIKKSLIASFGLVFSVVAFADFGGQTNFVVDYVATDGDPFVAGANETTTIPLVPGTTVPDPFVIQPPNLTCRVEVSASQITIGPCNNFVFGTGATFNGFRFTQDVAAPDITGVAVTSGTVSGAPVFTADSIAVNLAGQDLQITPVVLDVTFPTPVVNTSGVPVLAPLGLWLFGLLIAGVSYRVHRRR